MKRVLILGAGFGGLSAAHTLRSSLSPDDEIIVIDKSSRFIVGFRKTWDMLGEHPLGDGEGELSKLANYDIQYIQGTITKIDPEARAIEVDGRRLEGDALIVALGAQLAPQSVPGLSDYGLNIYSPDSLTSVKDALGSFGGGRLVVGIFGLPYKCSAAPYEIALLLNESMHSRGVAAEVEVFTPQPMSLPVLGDAGCGVIEGRLSGHGIGFFPLHKATSVTDGRIQFANGRERSFDLLLAIAPHRCPDVVAECSLTGGGDWVKVDPQTLQTPYEGVYAVGDIVAIPMANGKRLPMAGVFAEAEGQVAAQQIAAQFLGLESDASFSGFGGCYLEIGGGEAMMIEGNFLAQPAPQVELDGPNADYYQKKIAFERDRLQLWLA